MNIVLYSPYRINNTFRYKWKETEKVVCGRVVHKYICMASPLLPFKFDMFCSPQYITYIEIQHSFVMIMICQIFKKELSLLHDMMMEIDECQ